MYCDIKCVCVTCDNCGQTFTDEHSGFSIFVDENGAHEYVESSGWYVQDGKHYCTSCHSIDANDKLVLIKLENNSKDESTAN